MSSAARSTSRAVLSGPVAVCVDRPVLSLDRPFTYDLGEELEAGVGSLVQVPFHGRAVRGWVLGPTDDVPGRILKVRKAVSPVRFFDGEMLAVLRWVSERYVAPLASVIGRSFPPRVASEEPAALRAGDRSVAHPGPRSRPDASPLAGYRGGSEVLAALRRGSGAFVLRPAPTEEPMVAVDVVAETLAVGRCALVLVPEADPLPATAAAIRDAFASDVALYVGGSQRARYRTWLEIAAGRYRVVIGTRPAVFAPLPEIGLIYVARESHAQHREERTPYYHVRDVAAARARLQGGVAVLSAFVPSAEAHQLDATWVEPLERRWPPVEVVRPGPEGRAPRLVSALKGARRGFLFAPLPGSGVARVCRACAEPAACAACGGVLRAEAGVVLCAVCGADGRCAVCGATDFGIVPGGAERVEEWVRRIVAVRVDRIGPEDRPRPPASEEVLVGGTEAVKDFGSVGLDLVGILDADLAARRPGLSASERALATWAEAAAWAAPDGRVIVQSRDPNDPAVQALVSGNPRRFYRSELPRRIEAGFPVGAAVFRVAGTSELPGALERLRPITLLVSGAGVETLCLVALDPADVPAFGRAMRSLAERDVVARVEAEPHL